MYYPNNFYQNYPYQDYSNFLQTQQNYNLNGKIVDGIDMVKATEIPFSGFGVFPKGDLTEIYLKSWNNNGTTKIITYKPSLEEETKKEDDAVLSALLNKIENLEKKIDGLFEKKAPTIDSVSASNVKKEMKSIVY